MRNVKSRTGRKMGLFLLTIYKIDRFILQTRSLSCMPPFVVFSSPGITFDRGCRTQSRNNNKGVLDSSATD